MSATRAGGADAAGDKWAAAPTGKEDTIVSGIEGLAGCASAGPSPAGPWAAAVVKVPSIAKKSKERKLSRGILKKETLVHEP